MAWCLGGERPSKGLALIPILAELANWGVRYDPAVVANPLWVDKVRTDREGLYRLIRDTVSAVGAVFRGENSASSNNSPRRRPEQLAAQGISRSSSMCRTVRPASSATAGRRRARHLADGAVTAWVLRQMDG